MAYQGIGTGTTPNDNSGDSLLVGAVKVNSNFQEVYNALGDGTNIVLTKNRSINTGAGLTGGGNLNSDRTLSVLTGSGVTISQGLVGVDTSVIRTTGNQTIVGVLTATSFVKSGGTSSGFLKADGSVDTNAYITVASVPGAANDGQLTLQTSGIGLTGSQTFTANQSGNATFTITSNATSSNTSSTLVARDSSGNFSAGFITATSFTATSFNGQQVNSTLGSITNLNGTNLNYSGISTFSGSLVGNQASFVGVVTASSFARSGGTSNQFLKADGSVDSNAYLTSVSFGVIPIGGIIMWSGTVATIPTGWSLCDGANGTPDLRNRFVVGANNSTGDTTYPGLSVGATGGSADAIVPYHNHGITDPGHNHTYRRTFERGDDAGNDNANYARNFDTSNTSTQTTGITIDYAGTAGNATNANLPPYYALAFIMRTS